VPKATIPTRVLPLLISSLPTSFDTNVFNIGKLAPILLDVSITITTSRGHLYGGPTASLHKKIFSLQQLLAVYTFVLSHTSQKQCAIRRYIVRYLWIMILSNLLTVNHNTEGIMTQCKLPALKSKPKQKMNKVSETDISRPLRP